MSLPFVLVLAFILLGGAEAQAQPSPPRERRERNVTLTGNPAELPHEVRAAKGVATVLLFKSRINEVAVEVDRTRVRLLDVGEWSIIFEPLIELGQEDRWVLSVPLADAKTPTRAVFVLVSSPTEVDTRLEVVWLEPTVEACQAELAEAQARCSKSTPTRFARDGGLTAAGVSARRVKDCGSLNNAHGLGCTEGTAYVAETWVLVDVTLFNEPGQPLWVPREVTLKDMKSAVPLKLRRVEMETAQVPPGAWGRVLVEAAPPKGKGPFLLEVRDASGRGLAIGGVKLSAEGSKR